MVSTLKIEDKQIELILASICDPEIPVISIVDLGVVRSVKQTNDLVEIQITPTYSGCPAMDTISDDIKKAFIDKGYKINVELVLSPAWTTDLISIEGRKALEDYGIAAPLDESKNKAALLNVSGLVKCTNCNSYNTKLVSEFGSTACKALFKCLDCLEPFDYFKCLK